MATLQTTTFQNTDSVTLPVGNTASRSSPVTGMLRYNNASGVDKLEFYDGSGWRSVTGFSQGLIGSGGQTTYYQNGGIVHIYTSVGSHTFTPAHTGNVQVLVVAGGGSSGYDWAGGGGGGGVLYNRSFPVTTGTPYPVTVGGGGSRVGRGGNSNFGPISALGGGHGGSWNNSNASNSFVNPGPAQGSGGGGSNGGDGPVPNRYRMPPGIGTEGQGFPGGSAMRFNSSGDNCHWGGGGGGAGGRGEDAPDDRDDARNCDGGPGLANDTLGHTLYWGGGGAGGAHHGYAYCNGGVGGGGGGAIYHGTPLRPPSNRLGIGGGQAYSTSTPWGPGSFDAFGYANGGGGANNTGGGGGGGQYGANGGSGIVIVRY